MKLRFLREELSNCATLISTVESQLVAVGPGDVVRLLARVEVAYGNLTTFAKDPERMKHLNGEQQRELKEGPQALGAALARLKGTLQAWGSADNMLTAKTPLRETRPPR